MCMSRSLSLATIDRMLPKDFNSGLADVQIIGEISGEDGRETLFRDEVP